MIFIDLVQCTGVAIFTHLMHLACVAIGAGAGLHLAFTLHEGHDSAVRRMTGAPIGNLLALAVAAVVCTLFVAGWKMIRRQVFRDYTACVASQMRAELVIAGNAGSYTLPTAAVRYPFGLGGTAIDDDALAERLSRRLVVLLGENDHDPNSSSLPKTAGAQAQGPHRVARGKLFFRTAEQQAQRLGCPLTWTLQMVPGVAHDNTKMAPAAARAIFTHASAAVSFNKPLSPAICNFNPIASTLQTDTREIVYGG
jgi:hypothetical protein